MNLCSSDRDEICFEGRNCPLCAVIEQNQDEISKLENQIGDLEATISDKDNEITELQSQIPNE